MTKGQRKVSRSVEVSATPEEVFDLLADPRRHPELDGSGTLTGRAVGPDRLSLGARFGVSLHFHGVPYRVTNTVVEFEEGRLIAWRHFYRHVWRWQLEAIDSDDRPRTRVTETFDWGPAAFPQLLEWGKYPGLNARGMEKTLSQLQNRFA